MNQAELEARLAAIAPGGDPSKLQFVESTEKRKVTKQASQYAPPTEVEVSVPVRLWYDPATGRALKVDVNEDGTYAKTYDGIDNTLRKESAPAAATGQTTNVEGTPDAAHPEGNNENPRMVTRDKSGAIVKAEPLTPAERKQWDEDRQKSRNPGGKTDAEIQAQQTATVRTPDKDHPGLTIVTSKNPTTNAQETHYEDANGNTVPTPPDAPVVSSRTEVRAGKTYTVVTSTPKTGGTPTITVLGPDGQPVPGGLPDEGPKDNPTTQVGSDGKTYIKHSVAKPDGTADVYYTDQAGNRVQFPDDTSKTAGTNLPESLQGWRPDSTKPGWGLFERADQLSKAAAQGLIKPQDVPVILAREQQLTESAAAQHVSEQRQAESARTASQTQRGQDLTTQTSLRSNVGSMFSTAQAGAAPFLGKVAPPAGGSITGGLVKSQMALGQAMGAYDTPPDIEIPNFARPYAQASQAAAQSVPSTADLNDPTNAAWVRHDPLTNTPAPAAAGSPPPNALGAGAIGNQPAPGGGTVTPALTPPPVAPLLGPPPAVSASDPMAPPVGQGQPEMPAFANSMLSPRARLEALGYPPEVIEEALAHARAQGMAA